ncbi:MAG: hypothetical protein HN730_06240, partial [Bdellovibrionales bacterium]|nr:hypothetical protein [Bdellovibrionales bacterium]
AIDRCSIVAKSDLVNYIFNFNQGTDGAYALGFTAVTPNQLQPALESYFQDTNYYRCSIERSLPYVFEETLFYQGVDSGYTIMFDVAWDD